MLKRSVLLIPARTELYQAKLGFYLLIASLGMFFAASLITYVTIRYSSIQPPNQIVEGDVDASDPNQLAANQAIAEEDVPLAGFRTQRNLYATPEADLEPLHIPSELLISTVLLIAVSLLMHQAVVRISQERQQAFKRYLIAGSVFALAFIAIQAYGLIELIGEHQQTADGSTKLYGIAFTLAFIHALHVLGGAVFLGVVLSKAIKSRYDHERHWSVDLCAGYWHFLDVVWIAMLATFVLAN